MRGEGVPLAGGAGPQSRLAVCRGQVHGREERQLRWGVCVVLGSMPGPRLPASCSHPAPTVTLGAMLADARPGGTLRAIRER